MKENHPKWNFNKKKTKVNQAPLIFTNDYLAQIPNAGKFLFHALYNGLIYVQYRRNILH